MVSYLTYFIFMTILSPKRREAI